MGMDTGDQVLFYGEQVGGQGTVSQATAHGYAEGETFMRIYW
jgi:hypothetical protein